MWFKNTCFITEIIWKGKLIYSIFLICFGSKDSFNHTRTFCLLNLSLFFPQHFPIHIPLKVERALSNDMFEVYLARKKLLDWNVCPQIRWEMNSVMCYEIHNFYYRTARLRYFKYWLNSIYWLLLDTAKICHSLELLFVCFTSVKSSSSTKECRKVCSL